MDCDTLAVKTPTRNTYSDRVRKRPVKKPAASREAFPPLPNLPPVAAKPVKSRLDPVPPITNNEKPSTNNSRTKKSLRKAREVTAGSRFEVIGDADSWVNVRNSVGKKLSCPKVRIRSTKSGIVLFPEDKATLYADEYG